MTREEAIMILENNRPSCGERIIFKESEVYEAMSMAIEALSGEPSEDVISRQAAIDALRTCYDTETISMDNGDEYINYGDAVGEIEHLPSAQPEIIYCKDCKLFGEPHCLMFFDGYDWAEPDGYCHAAERREE